MEQGKEREGDSGEKEGVVGEDGQGKVQERDNIEEEREGDKR